MIFSLSYKYNFLLTSVCELPKVLPACAVFYERGRELVTDIGLAETAGDSVDKQTATGSAFLTFSCMGLGEDEFMQAEPHIFRLRY